jgi:hypothetical protein
VTLHPQCLDAHIDLRAHFNLILPTLHPHSGTDEYGTATETKALQEKMTPQQICDKYAMCLSHMCIREYVCIERVREPVSQVFLH